MMIHLSMFSWSKQAFVFIRPGMINLSISLSCQQNEKIDNNYHMLHRVAPFLRSLARNRVALVTLYTSCSDLESLGAHRECNKSIPNNGPTLHNMCLPATGYVFVSEMKSDLSFFHRAHFFISCDSGAGGHNRGVVAERRHPRGHSPGLPS